MWKSAGLSDGHYQDKAETGRPTRPDGWQIDFAATDDPLNVIHDRECNSHLDNQLGLGRLCLDETALRRRPIDCH